MSDFLKKDEYFFYFQTNLVNCIVIFYAILNIPGNYLSLRVHLYGIFNIIIWGDIKKHKCRSTFLKRKEFIIQSSCIRLFLTNVLRI